MDLSHLYEKTILFAPKAVSLCSSASFSKKIGEEVASISYRTNEDALKIDIQIPHGYRGVLILAPFKTKNASFAGIETKLTEGSFHREFSLKG